MAYLTFIVVTLALAVGWIALVGYESRTGVRYAAIQRANLDARVEHFWFLLAHVDFVSFIRSEVRHFVSRAGHDLVELSLRSVRAVERFLTQMVRSLRMRRPVETHPQGNAREFIKNLAEFKNHLQPPHSELPDIQ